MEAIRYENSEIDERIIRAVTEIGYEEMTPIQQSAIPALLEGRDIIGQAQTGTGKTAAFGIPLVQMIDPEDERVQAIVLCPTRELAIQAADELRRYAKYLPGVKGFRCTEDRILKNRSVLFAERCPLLLEHREELWII